MTLATSVALLNPKIRNQIVWIKHRRQIVSIIGKWRRFCWQTLRGACSTIAAGAGGLAAEITAEGRRHSRPAQQRQGAAAAWGSACCTSSSLQDQMMRCGRKKQQSLKLDLDIGSWKRNSTGGYGTLVDGALLLWLSRLGLIDVQQISRMTPSAVLIGSVGHD